MVVVADLRPVVVAAAAAASGDWGGWQKHLRAACFPPGIISSYLGLSEAQYPGPFWPGFFLKLWSLIKVTRQSPEDCRVTLFLAMTRRF